jgi:hypothetical protein
MMPKRSPSWMRGSRMMAAMLALGLLVPGLAWAVDTKGGPDQVVEGAKEIGRGVEDTAKGIGQTVTEGAKEVGHRAQDAAKQAEKDGKPVGDRLHDSAKDFGEAIWDGMKYVGKTLEAFFTGKK